MLTHALTRWPFALLHVIAFAGLLLGWWGAWPLVITLALHLALLAWGSATPGAGFFIAHARSLPDQQLALTYDDGPVPERTPALLDLLKREQVQATFFCIGERVERAPDLAKRIVDEGHAIGVHTQRHAWWWGFMRPRAARREIELCADAIAAATGRRPTLMRPPFGVTSPATARAIRDSGMIPVAWDLRTFDTAVTGSDTLIQRTIPRLKRASIVLMHDHAPAVMDLTKAMIHEAGKLGRKLVRLEAMMLSSRMLCAVIACGTWFNASAQQGPQPIGKDHRLVQRLHAQASTSASVQARFTQEKRIKGLSQPIISEGRFAFQAPDRMRWEVSAPESLIAVVVGKSVRMHEHGAERSATAREKQVFEGIQRLVGSLFTGTAFAEGGMQPAFFSDGDALLVELKPDQPGMKSRIDRIMLRFTGATLLLQELSIIRPNGDVTITRFQDASHGSLLPKGTFDLP